VASDYRLRIVYEPTGEYVEWIPGSRIESDVVEELALRVSLANVGLMTTRAQVVAVVRSVMQDVLHDLKKQVR
jgi:hypothetical protein